MCILNAQVGIRIRFYIGNIYLHRFTNQMFKLCWEAYERIYIRLSNGSGHLHYNRRHVALKDGYR